MVKFTLQIRNWRNQKKNQISDSYFSNYGYFCDVITPIFDEFVTITRIIKIGKLIFHSSQDIAHHP